MVALATHLYGTVSSIGAALRRTTSEVAGDPQPRGFGDRLGFYKTQEAYYFNTAFDPMSAAWDTYKHQHRLPRDIRPIYNPTKRAVDFYRSAIYGGEFPPWTEEVPDELRAAAEQTLQWGNWRSERYVFVGTAAVCGDVFLEIVDDRERAKIYPKVVHPSLIADLDFNGSGDVIRYVISYQRRDNNDITYQYAKAVDRETVTTYRDGRPTPLDGNDEAQWEHGYGFCPGHWVMFRDVGTGHGANVIDGLHPKIDNLNGLASAAGDYLMQLKKQPVIIKSSQPPEPLLTVKRGSTADRTYPGGAREEIPWLHTTDTNADVLQLLSDYGVSAVLPIMQSWIEEIEHDLPETSMYRHLREMTGATGPAIGRAQADVQSRVDEVAGNCDHGLIKAAQMCVAIGGEFARRGVWKSRTGAQAVFRPFDLSSFDRGDLAMDMRSRPLVEPTPQEEAELAASRERIATPAGLREVGYSDEQIYGEGRVPDVRPGLLDERREAQASTVDLFGSSFNAGL